MKYLLIMFAALVPVCLSAQEDSRKDTCWYSYNISDSMAKKFSRTMENLKRDASEHKASSRRIDSIMELLKLVKYTKDSLDRAYDQASTAYEKYLKSGSTSGAASAHEAKLGCLKRQQALEKRRLDLCDELEEEEDFLGAIRLYARIHIRKITKPYFAEVKTLMCKDGVFVLNGAVVFRRAYFD